jgi:hypothetical protein
MSETLSFNYLNCLSDDIKCFIIDEGMTLATADRNYLVVS